MTLTMHVFTDQRACSDRCLMVSGSASCFMGRFGGCFELMPKSHIYPVFEFPCSCFIRDLGCVSKCLKNMLHCLTFTSNSRHLHVAASMLKGIQAHFSNSKGFPRYLVGPTPGRSYWWAFKNMPVKLELKSGYDCYYRCRVCDTSVCLSVCLKIPCDIAVCCWSRDWCYQATHSRWTSVIRVDSSHTLAG